MFSCGGGGINPAEELKLQFDQAAVAFPGPVLKFFRRCKAIGLLSSRSNGCCFYCSPIQIKKLNPSRAVLHPEVSILGVEQRVNKILS